MSCLQNACVPAVTTWPAMFTGLAVTLALGLATAVATVRSLGGRDPLAVVDRAAGQACELAGCDDEPAPGGDPAG